MTDTLLPGGLRLVVLPAPTSPVVEARLVLQGPDAPLARALHDPPVRAVERDRDLLIVAATGAPDRLDDCLRGLAAPPVVRAPAPARHTARDDLRGLLLGTRFAAHPLAATSGADDRVAATPTRTALVSGAALLLLAGAVRPAEAVTAATRHLGHFTPDPRARSPIRVRERFASLLLVDDPDATSATVLAAAPAPWPSDDAFAAVLVAAELVGGGPDAPLHRGLHRRFPGLLSATCVVEHAAGGAWLSVEVDVLGAAGAEVAEAVLAELAAPAWRMPTREAWRAARAATFRSTVLAYAGTAQTATACARAVAYGSAPGFWPALPDVLADVGIHDVTAAARRYFSRASFAVAASGPAHPEDLRTRSPYERT